MTIYRISLRVLRIQPRTLRARVVIPAKSFAAMRFSRNNCDPMPIQLTPALNQEVILSSVACMPPVGMMSVQGQGSKIDLTNFSPSIDEDGKSLTISTPNVSASEISVGVAQPGK